MRPFSFIFTRRFLIPCGALASSTIIGSVTNVSDQNHRTILKNIRRFFSERLMGGKGKSNCVDVRIGCREGF